MFYHLEGTVVDFEQNLVVLDCGGIGFALNATSNTLSRLRTGEKARLFVAESIGENNFDLFGFADKNEKSCFEMLISVQGIGPKAGIAILSIAEPEEVRNAIANADTAFISKASGVGKKSAERVIVDLRDKVGIPSHYGATPTKYNTAEELNDEALDALMALGFSLKEASLALEKIDRTLPTEERIKLALKK